MLETTSKQKVNLDNRSQVRVSLNPWLFLWVVVSGWIWVGILRVARVLN